MVRAKRKHESPVPTPGRVRTVTISKPAYIMTAPFDLEGEKAQDIIEFLAGCAGGPVRKLSEAEKEIVYPGSNLFVFEYTRVRELTVIDGSLEKIDFSEENPYLDGDLTDSDRIIKAAADLFDLPISVARKALADARKALVSAEKETTGRVRRKPRPQWELRKGADAKLSPPEFIAKHYAAEMAAGTLHRGMIAQEDKPLAVKLASWLRSHPMPEGIDIPTKPEWITRGIEAGKARQASVVRPRTEGQRLYDALRGRHRRATM